MHLNKKLSADKLPWVFSEGGTLGTTHEKWTTARKGARYSRTQWKAVQVILRHSCVFHTGTGFSSISQEASMLCNYWTLNKQAEMVATKMICKRQTSVYKQVPKNTPLWTRSEYTASTLNCVWPWQDVRCPPKPPSHSPSQLDKGRENIKILVGRDKDREKSLTSYCHGQNRLDLGKLV